ncbi:WxL domain-containing protein [Vagococcus humatus]|uniref:WxL domain-containing protein n=1 Tax=Vagococcus humatus TaxID=1889241 RepID=A0A429Z7Y4_9ENTE|nr:WxL domain-containing protein [Vagococcus humatus]RST89801.1 hypothetical protein C7P63_01605 [Vagococcus humatus]
MKKKVLSSLLLSTLVLGAVAPTIGLAAEPEKADHLNTKGDITFLKNIVPTDPVDPTDPDPDKPIKPVDPTDPDRPLPVDGLSIIYASNFHFGFNYLEAGTAYYSALNDLVFKSAEAKTEADKNVNAGYEIDTTHAHQVAHSVQVAETRPGEYASPNWTVKVKQNGDFVTPEYDENGMAVKNYAPDTGKQEIVSIKERDQEPGQKLKETEIILANGIGKVASTEGTNEDKVQNATAIGLKVNQNITIKPTREDVEVMTFENAKPQGVGTYVAAFGDVKDDDGLSLEGIKLNDSEKDNDRDPNFYKIVNAKDLDKVKVFNEALTKYNKDHKKQLTLQQFIQGIKSGDVDGKALEGKGLEDLTDIQEFTFNKLKNEYFAKNRNKNVQLKLPKNTEVNVDDKYMASFTWTLTAAPGKEMPSGDNGQK